MVGVAVVVVEEAWPGLTAVASDEGKDVGEIATLTGVGLEGDPPLGSSSSVGHGAYGQDEQGYLELSGAIIGTE